MAGGYVHLPAAALRVWDWFWLLDRTRNGNGYSPDRITFEAIRALAGQQPAEWELHAILAMDAERLALFEENKAEAETLEPMTPDKLRGVFDPGD